jgi:hypothetical protein
MKLEGVKCILGVIFFPIIMIMGIVAGFIHVTCKIAPEKFSLYFSLLALAVRRV